MGETCGAITGAFMVIGLKYGKAKVGDDEAREQTYKLAREFVTRFKARHESIVCRDLLNCDLSKPEEREAAHHEGLFDTLCPQFVGDAAEILEQML
jgi:C_GCAxxG_C_C family probable redox protein